MSAWLSCRPGFVGLDDLSMLHLLRNHTLLYTVRHQLFSVTIAVRCGQFIAGRRPASLCMSMLDFFGASEGGANHAYTDFYSL